MKSSPWNNHEKTFSHFFSYNEPSWRTNERSGKSRGDIQSILHEFVDEDDAIGVAVGIIDQGKVSYLTYGKKSLKNEDPITTDTIFEIGSITKTFTTCALMDMVKSGEVQLDDPAELYLSKAKIPEKDGKKITLRHLATHNSGLPRVPDNIAVTLENPYADYTVEKLYHFLNHHHLEKIPGEHFEYSNLGMGLLGHVLSVKANKSYEDLLREKIFSKLGMENTTISLSSETKEKMAKGHHLKEEVANWDFDALQGAGAIRSTIKDMTLYLAANMGLLNTSLCKTLQDCHEVQHSFSPSICEGLAWQIMYGIITHSGGTQGFRSYLGFNPKNQKGIVILTNSSEDPPDELTVGFLDPENYKKPPIDKSLARNPDYLFKFIGEYEIKFPDGKPQTQLEIIKFGKMLITLSADGEMTFMYPEQYGIFGFRGVPDYRLHFIFDENNKITKMEMMGPNGLAYEGFPKA